MNVPDSGCRGHPIELLTVAHPEVDPRGDGLGEILGRIVQPREHGSLDARCPQLERLNDVDHPEPVCATGDGRPGGGHSAMTVSIGLHDHHRRHIADSCTQRLDVARDGAEVDECLAHHGEDSTIT